MEAGGLRLCIRHWVKPGDREQLVLSGYGVQLAIKSTEYKAMDDTKVKEGESGGKGGRVWDEKLTKQNFKFFWAGDGSKSESVDTLDEEVGGFNFTRLKYTCCINRLSLFTPSLLSILPLLSLLLRERYSHLESQLDDFKRHLLDKKKDLPQLKAWELSGE